MAPQLNDGTVGSERRRYGRQNVLFSSAELETGNGGIVLNISEGGVALHAVSEILSDELPNLRFQISLTDAWIETKGRVVWRSHSKRTAGVQFTELAETSRERIKNWIAQTNDYSADDPSGAREPGVADRSIGRIRDAVVAESAVALVRAVETGALLKPARMPFQQTATTNGSRARPWHSRTVYWAGGLVLLASAAYVAWRNTGNAQSLQEFKTAASSSAVSSKTSDSLPGAILRHPTSSGTAVHQTPPSSEYGFVLQVGAIKNEKNALALAEQLRQKNFSVFVAKSGESNLYRVLVGPYGDAATAAKSEAELRSEGFQSIRQENKPIQ
jgi:cell division septation protein DedD